MMAIIDGTGPWFNDDDRNWMPWNWGDKSQGYTSAFANSYCKQTEEALKAAGQAVQYSRGPSLMGLETGPYARNAVDWIKRNHSAGDPIYLMGFSRGAAAVVTAASFLKSEAPQLKIDALFLFDAVDRSLFTDAETVPSNVGHCHHVVRDYSFITWLVGRHRHNRWYFNNDALTGEPGVKMDLSDPFRGSHGAMGGTPWDDAAADPYAVIAVASWMNAKLREHGLPVRLNPARCYPQGSDYDKRVETLLSKRAGPSGLGARSGERGLQNRQYRR